MNLPLSTLDPAAGLDDLEPLAEMIGAARIVGIGESAHNVPEYQQLRHRLVRFLVERMGFSAVALESGFSEGLAVDEWIKGGAGSLGDVASRGLTYGFGAATGTRDLLAWMRETGGVSYTGLDLPADLASALPALDSVAAYLAGVDPEAVPLAGRARRLTGQYAGRYTMAALAAYREMTPADRDALTVALAELAVRFDTLRPFHVRRAGAARFETVRHELRLAVLLDQLLRAQAAGQTALNVRDAAMADTALRRLGGSRMIISAANTHLQRIPLGQFPVLGAYLADALGDDYVAIAVTCAGGVTPSRRAAPAAPSGVEVTRVKLEPPAEGSVEAMLGGEPRVTDLRGGALSPPPRRLRNLDSYVEIPVAEAFDLVACLPEIGQSR